MQIALPTRVLTVGQNVDVRDSVNKWTNAEILLVKEHEVYIHYTGWSSKYDQYILIDSERILVQWEPNQQLQINNRVDAYHQLGGWLEARVIQLKEEYDPKIQRLTVKQAKVHFVNYHPRYDLWLDPHNINHMATIGSKSKARGSGRSRKNKGRVVNMSELAKQILHRKLNNMVAELKNKDLVMIEVQGDGNCLFRSVSDQLYGCEDHYSQIRAVCMRYILGEKAFFQNYIVEEIQDYVQRKAQDGVWGDDVEIQAISQIYSRPIEIYATGGDPIRTFHEDNEEQLEPMRLAYVGSCHYNSIKQQNRLSLLRSPFGEFEDMFYAGYDSAAQTSGVRRYRTTFANSNTVQDAIEERVEAETKMNQEKLSDVPENLEFNKILEISETQALLQQIEKAEMKQLQNKYEQEQLQEEIRKIEEKEIEQVKKQSQTRARKRERPYWFGDLLLQGFAEEEVWFAIEVKGYDPDAVLNFLFDS